jgi:hypothetical protein
VCGWTTDNNELRINLVNGLNSDIISLCETHLGGNDVLLVPGYTWIGHNRQDIHVNAPKPSGGVGLLVKSWLYEEYEISVIEILTVSHLGTSWTNQSTNMDAI